MHNVAFTGHRVIAKGDYIDITLGFRKLPEGFYHPHTGGAAGFDTLIYKLVAHNANTLHVPFEYQLEALRAAAIDVYVQNTTYCQSCPTGLYRPESRADNRFYQIRNEHMVDLADEVICYWNGVEKGGTWNTIEYARRVGKPVRDIREI